MVYHDRLYNSFCLRSNIYNIFDYFQDIPQFFPRILILSRIKGYTCSLAWHVSCRKRLYADYIYNRMKNSSKRSSLQIEMEFAPSMLGSKLPFSPKRVLVPRWDGFHTRECASRRTNTARVSSVVLL